MDKEQERAFQTRDGQSHEWAHERVTQCISNPTPELLNDPMTQLAAEFLYHNQPAHQCYWNSRFAIAVGCQLHWTMRQRMAAWASLNNSRHDYWEWTTHGGYDLLGLLKRLNLVDQEFQPSERESLSVYDWGPDQETARKIAEYFDLPTKYFDPSRNLTESQQAQARWFNTNSHFHTL